MEVNKIYNEDCRETMKRIPDGSIDSIVTDPPYELGFMGKSWDNTGIAYNVAMWKECLRILKPGGHLLAFGGTRTYHRMACAIEDAGFEVRDMIEWVYGSGFPKSLNIGKAVDKISPRLGQFDKFAKHLTERIKRSGKSQKELAQLFPSKTGGLTGCVWNWANGVNVPTVAQWKILKPLLNLSDDFLPLIERIEREREVVGKDKKADLKEHVFFGDINKAQEKGKAIGYGEWNITKGTSEWEGWGTALKPAHEPICMARKPLSEKTVAENCLKWGCGGINIDESRVDLNGIPKTSGGCKGTQNKRIGYAVENPVKEDNSLGRFPANLLHDNSEEVRECFPETKSGGADGNRKGHGPSHGDVCYGEYKGLKTENGLQPNSGNASRFFKSIIYTAKASKNDRGKDNNHPTVKPTELIRYLINLVTPANGIVFDPFSGSGTTAKACIKEKRKYICSESDNEHFTNSIKRIKSEQIQTSLLF